MFIKGAVRKLLMNLLTFLIPIIQTRHFGNNIVTSFEFDKSFVNKDNYFLLEAGYRLSFVTSLERYLN